MIKLRRIGRWLGTLAGLAAAVLVTIVPVHSFQASIRLPDLQAWHQLALEEEFRATAGNAPATFGEYRPIFSPA